MSTTQKSLAQELGVHPATVSRALRDDPSIPELTRTRVKALAERLGYEPNYHAKSLRSRQTNLISILKRDLIIQDIHAKWIKGLMSSARTAGYKTRIDALEDAEKVMSEGSADGFIIFGDEVREHERARFVNINNNCIPSVFIDCSQEDFPVNGVVTDNAQGIKLVMRHLANLGHEHIAFFGVVEWSSICTERHRAYIRTRQDMGLPSDASYSIAHHCWSAEASHPYEYTEQLLRATRTGATAVIASSDLNAVGAIRILEEAGFVVPKDISVVGFDDSLLAALSKPALTTVRQNTAETAESAVELLISTMAGDPPKTTRVIAPELVIRASTGIHQPTKTKKGVE